MNVKRSVTCLAMAGSALAGGALFGPALAGAQEEEPQDQEASEQNEGGEREGPGPCGGPGRGRHLEAAATAIGIEVDALREALRNDQTVAEVAEANGVDPQTVVDALVADVSARIDEKVAEGELTQEEADEKKAELPERMTALVNGERPARPEREGEGEEQPSETTAS
jgi:hypothetical protein